MDLVRPACVIFNCCFKSCRVFLNSVSEGAAAVESALRRGADVETAVFMVGNGRIVLSCCHVGVCGAGRGTIGSANRSSVIKRREPFGEP